MIQCLDELSCYRRRSAYRRVNFSVGYAANEYAKNGGRTWGL